VYYCSIGWSKGLIIFARDFLLNYLVYIYHQWYISILFLFGMVQHLPNWCIEPLLTFQMLLLINFIFHGSSRIWVFYCTKKWILMIIFFDSRNQKDCIAGDSLYMLWLLALFHLGCFSSSLIASIFFCL